jgi:hypothetical protein
MIPRRSAQTTLSWQSQSAVWPLESWTSRRPCFYSARIFRCRSLPAYWGPPAFHGGAGTYILGVLLHFFIACSAAAIYFAVSRKLIFLTEHPLVCGMFFGAAVQLVMSLVVLPLSALHAMGPYSYHDLVSRFLVHMVIIGLPISFSIWRFARQLGK